MTAEVMTSVSYRKEYWALGGAWLSMVIGGIGFGMVLPLLPLVMNRWGMGEAMIGYNGMAQSLALLLMSLVVVKVFRRFHLLPTMLAAGVIAAGCTVLLYYFQNWTAWFVLRLILGSAYAFSWIGFEVWTNHLAPEHQRGRILGFYAALFAGPTALGPIILGYIGTDGLLPFLLIGIFYLIGALPMWIGYKLQPDFRAEEKVKLFSMIRLMPFLILCALMAGIGDGAAWNMMSLFGVKSGMSEPDALMLSTAFLLGSLIFQFPIGYLADKLPRMRLLIVIGAIGAVSCATVALSIVDGPVFWLATTVSGGMLMGVYVLSLAVLGQRFKGGAMAAANTVFVIVFELGTFTGGPIAGGFMEFIHPTSLLWMMALACVVVMIGGQLSRRLQRKTAPISDL